MLKIPLRLVLKQLVVDLARRVPDAGSFEEICRPLPMRGYSIRFLIAPIGTEERRTLAVKISPADRSHHTTHYVKRGTRAELERYLKETPEEAWVKLVEDLCRGCDSFYYP